MLPAWMIDKIKKNEDEENVKHIGDEAYPIFPGMNEDDDDEEEEVLECGSGGGTPPPPPPPDPMAEAKAQMALEADRARIAEENRVKEEARAAEKLKADTADFQNRLGGAYSAAQTYGSNRLRALGIDDQYGILPAYESELSRVRGTVPNLDPNPSTYFTPALFESALGGAREGQRTKLTRAYETAVPQGFDVTDIPDTADDALINSIIGEQYGEASDYLNRARQRGTLNDIGYETANRALAGQRSAATARANELGMGVLQAGRQSLRDIDTQARRNIADWNFGDNFDPNTYTGRITAGVNSFTGGLEGRLRNAFGSTEFFDPEALIAKGGKAQGAINTGAQALTDAMTEEERRRTAGSVGAF